MCKIKLKYYFRGYGAVFKAVHKETGFTLAIKTLALNGAGRSDLQKEIDILKKCRCNNVLSYYGSAVVKNEIWVYLFSLLSIYLYVSLSILSESHELWYKKLQLVI